MWRQLLTTIVLGSLSAFPALAGQASPAVGTVPPDFKTKNVVTGETLRLSEQRGKIVVLTFWATWCGPCRKELPILEAVQRQVGKDHLEVLAVAFHETPDNFRQLKKVATEKGWQLALIEDDSGRIASHYEIKAIPHLFIIGRDGKVLAEHTGYGESSLDSLVDELNRALRPDAPPAPETTPTAAPETTAQPGESPPTR